MKIRRALATAAATAVIVPLALLSAPTAFADTTPDTSTSAPAADESTPAADESTPAADQSSQPADDGNGSTPGTDDPAGDDGTPGTGTPSNTAIAPPSPSSSSTPSDEPSDEPDECPTDEDGIDVDSQLSIDVSGLPGKIVAGSGWHTFQLTAANHSDKSLGTVHWAAAIDSYHSDPGGFPLSNFTKVQYLNPRTKAWESIDGEVFGGYYFGETELGPKATVDIKLRVDITARAEPSDAYSVGFGGYLDTEKNCVHSSFALYEFEVLAPGSSNEDPGEAKPGKGGKPTGGKEPQGGADEIPATGNLASTGSSSALPMIGLVGGVAVVAGAGAVFMVRRRKDEARA
ncbi:LAETG motif-containing sortase-dependent surface protein [Streptomyces sp. NPDC002306]